MSTLDEALPLALDQHLAGATRRPPIIAAKLDTEGMECTILEGGASLLAVHRPLLVLVEVKSHTRRWQMPCVKRFAAAHGYRVTYREKGDNAFMVRPDVKIVATPVGGHKSAGSPSQRAHRTSSNDDGGDDKTLVTLPEWKG